MAETILLTAPIVKPSQTMVLLDRITIDITNKSILFQWTGDNGEASSAVYSTPPPIGSTQPSGATLLSVLNTANLSTTSLVKRIFQRLQLDGYLPAGSIVGTPV